MRCPVRWRPARGRCLLVDATQGVQAQTVANAYLAVEAGLEIIPVINKVDLPAAQPQVVAEEIEHILGFKPHECFHISAKSGIGVEELLHAIVTLLPPPADKSDEPTAALIFDSVFDEYRGVICYVRVFGGELKIGQKIRMMGTGRNYLVTELGKFAPKMMPINGLTAGEVGYVIANIRTLADVTIGDTITDENRTRRHSPCPAMSRRCRWSFPISIPATTPTIPKMRSAFEKLSLNDASFSFFPQNSPALGFGFRCGFLGLLHMEIIQERLERENDIDVVQTAPTVSYEVVTTDGKTLRIDSPSQMPERTEIEELREPYVRLEIITPKRFHRRDHAACRAAALQAGQDRLHQPDARDDGIQGAAGRDRL